MSSKQVKFRTRLRAEANQDQILMAKGQVKNIWKEVSTCLRHLLHIEGMLLPLNIRFS
jgi:hypothetical protein